MKKKKKLLLFTFGAILLLIIMASATSQYWGKLSFKTQNTKGKFFKINLSGEPAAASELAPGDSFSIEPVIENLGTEGVFCFITIKMRRVSNNAPAFSLSISNPESWRLLKQVNYEEDYKSMCTQIYAYSYYQGANSELLVLYPEESTPPLTDKLTLSAGLTDFSSFDDEDVNVVVSGIGLSAPQFGDISYDPGYVWNMYLNVNGDDEDIDS